MQKALWLMGIGCWAIAIGLLSQSHLGRPDDGRSPATSKQAHVGFSVKL